MTDHETAAGVGEPTAMAAPACEHYWGWVKPAGSRKSAKICQWCHAPDADWLNHVVEVDRGHGEGCVQCEFADPHATPAASTDPAPEGGLRVAWHVSAHGRSLDRVCDSLVTGQSVCDDLLDQLGGEWITEQDWQNLNLSEAPPRWVRYVRRADSECIEQSVAAQIVDTSGTWFRENTAEWIAAHPAPETAEHPEGRGVGAGESGAGERVVTTLLHSFTRSTGMCRCGEGPFNKTEWVAHYNAQDEPTRTTTERGSR